MQARLPVEHGLQEAHVGGPKPRAGFNPWLRGRGKCGRYGDQGIKAEAGGFKINPSDVVRSEARARVGGV